MSSPIPSILFDRRFLLGTPGRVIGLLVLVNIVVVWRETSLERARQENLLVNSEPVTVGRPVPSPRYDRSVGDSLDKYLPAIPDARTTRLVILTGMSQMYAINERQPGDQTISEHLDDMLTPFGVRVFGLAAPNLDNEETLFLFHALLATPSTTPKVFVYGVCFDKMRFVDLRPSYLSYLGAHPDVRTRLEETASQYATIYPLATEKIRKSLESMTKLQAEGEASGERLLRQAVGRYVPLVRFRRELSGFLLYEVLYQARNKVLGITNTSKRPILQGRYDLNKEFLLLLIDLARKHNVRFAMYIVPLNPQAENPYIAGEYEGFKKWLSATASQSAVPYANLEDAVPREDWGLFLGGPDFKHFRGPGHLRTAEALRDRFGDVFVGRPPR